jgi:rhodanese-related sulfurtransferase
MEPGWKPVQPQDLPHVLQRPKTGGEPCLVIDARDASAYVEAHIDGAINVPVPTFTPRSGAEFGHMYSLTQLESDLEPKAARKFQGRKGRRVLIYDDGAQGTESSGESLSSSTKSRVTTKPTFIFAPANAPSSPPRLSRTPLISTPTGPMQHMQHLQGGGFRIYPCLFLASLLDEERRVSDPSDPNSQPCAQLFVLIGGTMPHPCYTPIHAPPPLPPPFI